MNRLFCFLFVVGVLLAGGCSGSSDKKDDKKGDGGKRAHLTEENFNQIAKHVGIYGKNDLIPILGGSGKPTNDELPGLVGGDKMVWEEDGKKLYVSFDFKGKVNGLAKKGF